MTILTGDGSFAKNYTSQFEAEITSIRTLGESEFLKKLSTATTIIHNAATLESTDLELSTKRNFDFTRYLVEKVQELNPTAHFVFLSSMSILDPTNDKAYGNVLTMTPYAYSKYLAETFCLKSELPHVSCIRFSTLFFQDPKKDGLSKLVVNAVTNKHVTIFNKGQAERNFLPLHVAAQYVQKIATQTTSQGKHTYNLAGPHATSFGDIVKILHQLLPDLTIEDKSLPEADPVLSAFSTDDIEKLGKISFSLKNEIAAYIGTLQS